MTTLWKTKKERLLEILFETSFQHAPTPMYPLASGTLSHYYIDCKKAFSYPEARTLIGELMYEKIIDVNADAIGGIALGAYPLAIAISDIAYKKGYLLRVFVVRKESKDHGLKKTLEGDIKKGDRVVIVEDVVTTGRSTIEAIEKSREAGLEIVKVIALIDRQEGKGRVECESLFTLQDFISLL